MTNTEREYLILAVAYMVEYQEEQDIDAELKELYDFLAKEAYFSCNKNMNTSIKVAKDVTEKLESLYKDNDVTANLLCLALNLCMLLVEDDAFKGSKGMKLKRLTISLYNRLSDVQNGNEGFKNSNRIISRLEDYNRGDNDD